MVSRLVNESSQERRRNVYGREWFRWGALTYVRIRLNQVKAKDLATVHLSLYTMVT